MIAAIGVGDIVAPWDWRTYVNQRFVKEADFRKQTELAAELIQTFEPPYGGQAKVVVVVDCSLLTEPVIQAAIACGYGFTRLNFTYHLKLKFPSESSPFDGHVVSSYLDVVVKNLLGVPLLNTLSITLGLDSRLSLSFALPGLPPPPS
ncbi:MAG: hypothetical protein ACE5JP_09695 [Candidatus Bipolaricaulia bacterium]